MTTSSSLTGPAWDRIIETCRDVTDLERRGFTPEESPLLQTLIDASRGDVAVILQMLDELVEDEQMEPKDQEEFVYIALALRRKLAARGHV